MSVAGVATTAGASSANNLQRNRNPFLRRNLRYFSFLALVICCGIWLVVRSEGMVEIFSPLSRTMDDATIITNHYYSASKNHSSGSGSSRSDYETDIVANTTTVNNNVIVAAATTTTPAATLVSNHNDGKQKITKEESKLFVVKQKQNKQQQQQQQNNNNNEHRIKFYAVHIGPSKTGTSAIQKDLARNPLGVNTLRKEKDDIIYVGKLIATNGKSKIRTIHGKSITITHERQMFARVTNCMLELLDNYYRTNSNTGSMAQINERLDTDEETRASLKEAFVDTCWKPQAGTYMLESSIIDSNEAYSYRPNNRAKLGKKFRIFSILGYTRLMVVGAYRRYADWIVSAYLQNMKNGPCLCENQTGLQRTKPCGAMKDFLDKYIPRQNNNNSSSYYESDDRTKWGVHKYLNLHATLPEIRNAGPATVETKILNYFRLQPTTDSNSSNNKKNEGSETNANETTWNSITTELYCDTFGKELMPHTCSYSRGIEHKRKNSPLASGVRNVSPTVATITSPANTDGSLFTNTGDGVNVVYQQIVATGYRLGFILVPENERTADQKNCQKSRRRTIRKLSRKFRRAEKIKIWCNATMDCVNNNAQCTQREDAKNNELDRITSNGTFSVVGTNNRTLTGWKDLLHYHTTILGLTWTNSLPVLCPPRKQLEELLKHSLEFEERIMPDFFATPLGKDTHQQLFWKVWLGEKKMFCWVDLERLFQNATSWDEIVQERMVNYDWGAVSYEANDGGMAL